MMELCIEPAFEKKDGTGIHKVWKMYGETELSMFLDNPTPSKSILQKFKSWLEEHADDYVRLYHGTAASNPIPKEGIRTTNARRRKSYQSQSGYVYLSRFPSMAKAFGEMNNYGRTAVYCVDVKISELKADIDQLNNKRAVGYEYGDDELKQLGTSLAESLVYGFGARIKRNIHPLEIHEVVITNEKVKAISEEIMKFYNENPDLPKREKWMVALDIETANRQIPINLDLLLESKNKDMLIHDYAVLLKNIDRSTGTINPDINLMSVQKQPHPKKDDFLMER